MFFQRNQSSNKPSRPDQSSTNNVDDKQVEAWLQYLYRESWQQELLITGITLFLLFQVPSGIDYLKGKILSSFYRNDLIISAILTMLHLLKWGSYILTFNILLDIFLRGLWIGLIGLSSAFPQGIRKERFKYTESLRRKILDRLVDPKESIIKLDRLCSIIFSFTFLIIFYLISIGLYFFYLLLLIFGIQHFSESGAVFIFVIAVVIYCLLTCIHIIDFITLGGLRRFKWIARLVYFVYKVFGFITLSFIYKNIYYTLVSNVKKRYLLPVFALYLMLAISTLSENNGSINRGSPHILLSSFYDNLRDESHLIRLSSIPQEHVEGNWLKVFTVLDLSREVINRYDSTYKEEDWEILNAKPNITNRILKKTKHAYRLMIDNTRYDSVDWLYMRHPETEEQGIRTLVNVSDLASGLHQLKVLKPFIDKNDSLKHRVSCTIPFWKE